MIELMLILGQVRLSTVYLFPGGLKLPAGDRKGINTPSTDFQKSYIHINYAGSGALSGKMLLVRSIVNNKIDAYFRSG